MRRFFLYFFLIKIGVEMRSFAKFNWYLTGNFLSFSKWSERLTRTKKGVLMAVEKTNSLTVTKKISQSHRWQSQVEQELYNVQSPALGKSWENFKKKLIFSSKWNYFPILIKITNFETNADFFHNLSKIHIFS